MDHTASTRATAATTAVALTAGVTTTLYGVITNEPARSLGGACLTMTALTAIGLGAVKRWVTDTHEEQHRLAQATQEAQDERAKYFAAQAALENEVQRLMRDAAADRARAAATLIAEREAMEADFAEKRTSLICEAIETYAQMLRSGDLDRQPPRSRVIQFPTQQPVQAPERERPRGHNVAGP